MRRIVYLMVVCVLAAGLLLAGCPEPEPGEDGELETVSMKEIGGITSRSAGQTRVETITETAQYTGRVSWQPEHDELQENTAYTATITLTAKQGYTFEGVPENYFKVVGGTGASNAADSGVVTAVFWTAAPLTHPHEMDVDCLNEEWFGYYDDEEDPTEPGPVLKQALASVQDPHEYGELYQEEGSDEQQEYTCDEFSDYAVEKLKEWQQANPGKLDFMILRAKSDEFRWVSGGGEEMQVKHHWVFIVVNVCGKQLFVPIECTPPGGERPQSLIDVPKIACKVWVNPEGAERQEQEFDERYFEPHVQLWVP